MPNSIRLKKSGVAGKVPLVTDLNTSELSYNYADGILYGKRTSGGVENVVEFAGSENHHLMKHLAAPGAPSSGYLRFYAKSDNKLYTFNSFGQEHQIIAGLFSGADEGHTLVYTESQWRSTDWIRLRQSGGYNTVEITSKESIDEFGNSQIYMSAEEGVFIHTNISKPGSASVSFTRYGITSSLLSGTGERFLVADADGTIKTASVQPTQFWQRNAGIISPLNQDDEVNAWLFKTGGLIMADGYLEYGKSGIYTLYNDMVVSEFDMSSFTFNYANSRLTFNAATGLLTVGGNIDAGTNFINAGEIRLTKSTPGGVARVQSYRKNPSTGQPTYLQQYDAAGTVSFEVWNGSDYNAPIGIIGRASQNHSSSAYGSEIEFWTTPNGTTNNRVAAVVLNSGLFKSNYGFVVGSLQGLNGSQTIITGCSYNSVTKTLLFTRSSITVTGGIVTSISTMSSLSVPLS